MINQGDERIKVAVAGVNGRMGRASLTPLLTDGAFELVGAFGRSSAAYVGCDLSEFTDATGDNSHLGTPVSSSFEELLEHTKPDVLLDFMVADASFACAKKAIEKGIRPVIGTSGLSKDQVAELSVMASERRLGAMVIPNFSIGAVLMMEFARQAAKYYSNTEIVEMHHTKKIDAPSGTALYTLNKMAGANKKFNVKEVNEHETMPHVRGAEHSSGIRVHSLRLPGLISHQDVIFGSDGELLTIRHDSFNTTCFLKGIALSVKAVVTLRELKIGLESVLEL
jgi:4-hydroxy-tetrahydrodipicolinate reductase